MAGSGNAALRAARQALGLRSQAALADAIRDAAERIGLRIDVAARTVRRWESAEPPWPHPEHAAALEALFGKPITELGFKPPWGEERYTHAEPRGKTHARPALRRTLSDAPGQVPAAVVSDYMAVTEAHRRMYWVVSAPRLHGSVAQHAQLGFELVPEVPVTAKGALGRAVSESSLLAGRIEFFDLQQPERSQASFVLALQAAHEANDALLGAATLTHMAFAPAFSGDPERAEEARERLRAARVFARRGEANAEMNAWIDAVEAETETRFGDTRQALKLLRRAEEAYDRHDPVEDPSPQWLDWFSPTRLAGFKGYTLMVTGQGRKARESLELALAGLPDNATKQRAVFLADIGAAAVLEDDAELACLKLGEALDLISNNWYATALGRIKSVRNTLRPWDSLPAVRALDERLYDWHTTVNSVGG